MATHSSILAWRVPMDRGAWWATYGPWDCKESNTTERLSTAQQETQSVHNLKTTKREQISMINIASCNLVIRSHQVQRWTSYAQSLSCVQLLWPHGCSLTGSSVRGILQARILEWVAISYSRGSSWPRDQAPILCISCIGRQTLNHCATKNSIAVPQKLKNRIYYLATPLWVYTPKNSKQGLELFMHTCVYSSIIHNSQELVATQVSVDQWMDNENMLFTNNGILTSLKKLNSATCYNLDETWGHYTKWNKPITKW